MLLRLWLIFAVALQPLLGWWSSPPCECCKPGVSCCGATPCSDATPSCCGDDEALDPCCVGEARPGRLPSLACTLCNAVCRTLCEQGPPAPMVPSHRAAAPKPPQSPISISALTRPTWPRPSSL